MLPVFNERFWGFFMSQSKCLDGSQPRFGMCVDTSTNKLFSDSFHKPPQPDSPESLTQKRIDAANPILVDRKREEEEAKKALAAAPFGAVAPFEKLKGYMNPDASKAESFFRFDNNKDGQITRVEIASAKERTVNKEELLMLQWMSDQMSTLENIGDSKTGFSTDDMAGFRKVYEEGPDKNWGRALQKHNWLLSGARSFSGAWLLENLVTWGKPNLAHFAVGGVLFGVVGALGTISEYQEEQQKIVSAAIGLKNLSHKSDLSAPQ